MRPQTEYVRALRAAIPDDGVLVSEMTQVGYVARVAYPVYEPRTFIHPGYQGTLGYGFPAALGVTIGRSRSRRARTAFTITLGALSAAPTFVQTLGCGGRA